MRVKQIIRNFNIHLLSDNDLNLHMDKECLNIFNSLESMFENMHIYKSTVAGSLEHIRYLGKDRKTLYTGISLERKELWTYRNAIRDLGKVCDLSIEDKEEVIKWYINYKFNLDICDIIENLVEKDDDDDDDDDDVSLSKNSYIVGNTKDNIIK